MSRKKPKTAVEIIREALEAYAARTTEPDRVVPLVCVEILNANLEEILRLKFTKEGLKEELQDRLLGSFTAPIYSFAMRTTMCRAFGLLPHKICDLLDNYRQIRNYCAHTPRIVTLNDEDIKTEVRAIQDFLKDLRGYKRLPTPRKAIAEACWVLDMGIIEDNIKGITPKMIRRLRLSRRQAEPPKKDRPSAPRQHPVHGSSNR
jgi:hypothetical protein